MRPSNWKVTLLRPQKYTGSALAPVSPLRRWRLLELGRGEALVNRPLKIDERVLEYLMGVSYLDERLQGAEVREVEVQV